MRLTSGENAIDPLTGIPIILGKIRITENGNVRTTQITGAPSGSTNQEPGTDIVFSSAFDAATGQIRIAVGGAVRVTQDGFVRVTLQLVDYPIGLPYGYIEVPETGPLT